MVGTCPEKPVATNQFGKKIWHVLRDVCMKRFMVRRNAPKRRTLVLLFGAPIAIFALVACGTYISSDPLVSNWFAPPDCPSHEDGSLAIPRECCPCPWPDMCPDGWPEVPAYCRTGCEPGQPHECCLCPTEEWCTKEAGQTYKPPEWCNAKPWLDGGADGSSAICPRGTCAPTIPEGWLGPASLNEGFDINVAPCPEGTITWDGSAEPAAPGCAECTCSIPASVCGNAPQWTISSRSCMDFDSGVKWNFDPPAGWDGSCNSEKSLPAGKMCGPEGLCVKSIMISPPKLEQIDKTCTPSTVPNAPPVPKLFEGASLTPKGRVCIDKLDATNLPSCGVNNQDMCTPVPGPGPACIARRGDVSCPQAWPDKHVYYDHVKDNRTCSECSCGPVEGASCKRRYSLYTDNGCTTEFGTWVTEDSDLPQCLWLVDGMAVGSKKLDTVDHDPGACKPSGGEVIGKVELNDPFTVCCASNAM